MPKVIGEMSGEADVKRFYMPGLKIEDECPDCKKTIHWDGERDYISYPVIGGDTSVNFNFYCDACNKNWNVKGSLSLTVKL